MTIYEIGIAIQLNTVGVVTCIQACLGYNPEGLCDLFSSKKCLSREIKGHLEMNYIVCIHLFHENTHILCTLIVIESFPSALDTSLFTLSIAMTVHVRLVSMVLRGERVREEEEVV